MTLPFNGWRMTSRSYSLTIARLMDSLLTSVLEQSALDRALAKQTRQLEHFHLLENSDSIVKFTLSSSVVVLLLWVRAVFSSPSLM